MDDSLIKSMDETCKWLDDNQLFQGFIFAKKSIEGHLKPEDFEYLEKMRVNLGIENQIYFHYILEKVRDIYYKHYTFRRRN